MRLDNRPSQRTVLHAGPNLRFPLRRSSACLRRGKRYGTTAVCALRIGNTVYVAHAGDSRAVSAFSLARGQGCRGQGQERGALEGGACVRHQPAWVPGPVKNLSSAVSMHPYSC